MEASRRSLIVDAAKKLDQAKMMRFEERTGYMHPTDLGRTASHYYIKYATVEVHFFLDFCRNKRSAGMFEIDGVNTGAFKLCFVLFPLCYVRSSMSC